MRRRGGTFARFIPEDFQGSDLPIRIETVGAEKTSSIHRASPTPSRSKAEMVTPFLAAQIQVKGLLRKAAAFMRGENVERSDASQ